MNSSLARLLLAASTSSLWRGFLAPDGLVPMMSYIPPRLTSQLPLSCPSATQSPAPSAVKLVNAGREGPGPSGPAVLLLGADSDLGARLATTLLDHGRRVQILEPAAAPALVCAGGRWIRGSGL